MSIKIIGGKARGLTLGSAISETTRPTSVLLKRRLFDAFQNMEHICFIDLCAGVGSIGLEAASRGAKRTFLIEKDPRSFSNLKKNMSLVKVRVDSDIQAFKQDVFRWLKNFKNEYLSWSLEQQRQTYIFFDPPYEKVELYQQLAKEIVWFKGLLMVEACRQKTMHEDELQKKLFKAIKFYRQGSSYIIIGDFREMT